MKKVIQFIVLTCIVSWTVAGLAIFFGLRKPEGIIFTIVAMSYMILPAICAIILQLIHKEKPFRNLNISFKINRWFFVAGFLPIIFVFLTLGINVLLPNVSFSSTSVGFLQTIPEDEVELTIQQLTRFSPRIFLLLYIVQTFVLGCTLNAITGFGEELGWRGYLLKELQDKKFLEASLIIGTVWGLWHFPFILIGYNYPQHPLAGVGMMIIFCILLTPIMIYIVIKSKSIIPAALFHGTINASEGIPILYLIGGTDLTNGITGIAGFISLFFMTIAFYLFDKYITKEDIFIKGIAENINFNREIRKSPNCT